MTELRRKKAINDLQAYPEKPLKHAMVDAGYSPAYAHKPQEFRNTEAVKKEYAERFTDEELDKVHHELLMAARIDHMVFPKAVTDEEIKELLATVGCTVKKIMHSDNANHAWFWSPDNMARDKALDKAYKLRSNYALEKVQGTLIHTQLGEYLDMIQSGGQKFITDKADNGEPITGNTNI